MEQSREAWGARWAFRLTGVISDLINSAHLLTHPEFVRAARDWSETVMIFPDWWRDIEDRYRDEAFGYEVEPIDFSLLAEAQAFWDAPVLSDPSAQAGVSNAPPKHAEV